MRNTLAAIDRQLSDRENVHYPLSTQCGFALAYIYFEHYVSLSRRVSTEEERGVVFPLRFFGWLILEPPGEVIQGIMLFRSQSRRYSIRYMILRATVMINSVLL